MLESNVSSDDEREVELTDVTHRVPPKLGLAKNKDPKANAKVVALILFIAGVVLLLYYNKDKLPIHKIIEVCEWIKLNPLSGCIIFVPLEVVWIVLCIPATPVEIAAGYIFGFWWGILVNSTAKLAAAIISFVLGRHCIGKYVAKILEQWFGEEGIRLLAAVDRVLCSPGTNSEGSFQLLIMIRLAYIPLCLKNYGLALCPSISLKRFVITSFVGEIPGSLAITWTGTTTRDLVALASGHASHSILVLLLGSISLILVSAFLFVKVKREMLVVYERVEVMDADDQVDQLVVRQAD